jgi:hypothetical protein
MTYQKSVPGINFSTYGFYYKNIGKSAFSKISKKMIAISTTLETIKKEDPTFRFTLQISNVFIKRFTFYHKGKDGTAVLQFEDNHLYLVYDKYKYKLRTAEDVEKAIRDLFAQIEKTTRIQNLFTPPKRYLSQVIKNAVPIGCAKESVYQTVQTDLLSRYTWEEIEGRCATYLETKEKQKVYIENFSPAWAIGLFDRYYLFRRDGGCSIFDILQHEDVADAFYEEVKEGYVQHLRKTFER